MTQELTDKLTESKPEPSVEYNSIKKTYTKSFDRCWSIDELVQKSEELITTIREVSKKYEKELTQTPATVDYEHDGMKVKEDSIESAKEFMKTKKQQKQGLIYLTKKFEIGNQDMNGSIIYTINETKSIQDCGCPKITLIIKPNKLTVKDRRFYHELYQTLK
ncbi:hypothetical protein HOK51_03255 [Candidatus Woesearchaeota archaeon]|jgi:hypothetical protein|nr:hypothetical protein [Candidatus Woesearchaeota archaeon]MBT6518837.1 hypothetical protein [Candidatus Woesearchaeota archaeon]MBT7367976.1 hypothetical protein [Candidatus Woesearchaeota archaeon]